MIIEITEKYQIGLGQKYLFITFKPFLLEEMNQCPLFDQLVTDHVWWNTFRKKEDWCEVKSSKGGGQTHIAWRF